MRIMMPNVDTAQSFCRVGVARGEITPPIGTYHRMWGAATHDRSTGVHRPLTATALVFRPLDEAASGEQVVVALDHCLLWAREMAALLATVCARTFRSTSSRTSSRGPFWRRWTACRS